VIGTDAINDSDQLVLKISGTPIRTWGAWAKSCRKSGEDIHDEDRARRVVDDFARDQPIDPAELDAVEAFLMPVVNAILSGADKIAPVDAIQKLPPATAPTHKRRKRPMLEEA
jgi:hypothetical protein